MNCLLEICVDSVESAQNVQVGGADRLELCSNLIIGGTSPTMALIKEVLSMVEIPVNVLLRPRFGDFCYTKAEKRVLLQEIKDCRNLGVNGVVIGALTPDGRLDMPFLAECIQTAEQLDVTLHRAFDLTQDPFQAMEDAISLGINTILTSGQRATAQQGAKMLEQLCEQAKGRICILAGSGVAPENMRLLFEKGIRQFHGFAKKTEDSPMQYRREGVPMGLPVADEYQRSYTDAAVVRRMKECLYQLK